VTDLVVVFRTGSDVEASIVRGLLEAHGVASVVSSSATRSLFPLTVNELGEVRLSVRGEDVAQARHIIETHREAIPTGKVVRLRDEFDELQRAIRYRFRDPGLLEHAMTHASRAHEDATGGVVDNESLEFLGDAVLGFVIADLLFHEFPRSSEGLKSKIKAALVSTAVLARQADQLGLGDHLLLGRGEEKSGGRRKQALLADGYEALIAAIYLDGGVEEARAFITREFAPRMVEVRERGVAAYDYKSALQEYLQGCEPRRALPEYRLAGALGPDHRKLFQVEVLVSGERLAAGSGSSKKEAEQEAARLALVELNRSRPSGQDV
jgi:ribonuclease-3